MSDGRATAAFEFGPGLSLEITADRSILVEFVAEYRSALEPGRAAPSDAVIEFAASWPTTADGSSVNRGGHKTVGWEVALDDRGESLAARIRITGRPRSFGRSLVQGYIVEPLLSVAAARRRLVLLPSAGILGAEGLIVILGRSRAGKSTLAARSLALGYGVLGDDQLIVDPDGAVWPFPRRLRFYPDLRHVAPAAFHRLRAQTRTRLLLRGVVSSLSRGFVRPSLAVRPTELGAIPPRVGTRPARVVLLERSDVGDLQRTPASIETTVAWAAELLAEQRGRLLAVGGQPWAAAVEDAAALETATLRDGFDDVPRERIVVPRRWPAARAISELGRALGLDGPAS